MFSTVSAVVGSVLTGVYIHFKKVNLVVGSCIIISNISYLLFGLGYVVSELMI